MKGFLSFFAGTTLAIIVAVVIWVLCEELNFRIDTVNERVWELESIVAELEYELSLLIDAKPF